MENLNNKTKKHSFGIYLLLFAILLLLPQAKALAATYYVDINGVGEDGILGTSDDVISSDANPGTAEAPWKTLGRAYTWYSGAGDKVTEGDTVLFRNGDYGKFREEAATQTQVTYRNDWVTYKAAPGHSPTISNIYINQLDKWGDILHGSSYLSFVGFQISNGITVKYTSYLDFNDCNITCTPEVYEGFYAPYYSSGAIGLNATRVYHGTVENCVFSYLYRGIRVGQSGGDYWTIKNNKIYRFAEDGIRPDGVSHLLIEGNLIYDISKARSHFGLTGTISGTFEVGETIIQAGSNAEGIVRTVGASTLSVYTMTEALFITIGDGGGTVTGQTSGATVSAVSKCDYSHSDPIQIQSSAVVTDMVIRGNTFIPSGSGTAYLRFYGYATDLTIENNLILDNSFGTANEFEVGGVTSGLKINNNTFCSGLYLAYGGASEGSKLPSVIDELYNNIMQGYKEYADLSDTLYTRVLSHGNNIFGSNPNGTGGPTYPFALNSTEAVTSNLNALFTNAAGNDYTLATGSAAINFGNPDYGPSSDILGNPRGALPDAGAYEYIFSTPPPPPPPIIYGDISGDSAVNLSDASMAAQYSVGLITLTAEQTTKGDVNGNGQVTAYDAAFILQKIAGLISKFPVE